MGSEEPQVIEIEIVEGSVEYLYGDVTADRPLVSQPVAMAVNQGVEGATWVVATWVGDVGLSRSCRILLDGTLAAGKYQVFVKITDTPEVPITKAGVLKVKTN